MGVVREEGVWILPLTGLHMFEIEICTKLLSCRLWLSGRGDGVYRIHLLQAWSDTPVLLGHAGESLESHVISSTTSAACTG